MYIEIEHLKRVCRILEQEDIPYMLTGSFAANFYAVPRMTRDIDIVLELFKPDIEKFFQAFHGDFYIDKDSIDDAIKNQGMFNIIHEHSVLKVDFIIRKDLSYRNVEFQRRRRARIEDAEIWIVSPEDLIISKLFWAKDSFSEMQIKDIRNIMRTLKHLDNEYIQKWIAILGLRPIYEKVISDA